MISAYLEDNPTTTTHNSWLNDTLIKAANWLKQHNPFLKNYSHLLDSSDSNTANPFSRASHLPDDDSTPPFLPNDIIIPNTNFNVEIHNEDYHYSHLMVGFVRTPNNTLLPLAIDDPDLEACYFLIYFQMEKDITMILFLILFLIQISHVKKHILTI